MACDCDCEARITDDMQDGGRVVGSERAKVTTLERSGRESEVGGKHERNGSTHTLLSSAHSATVDTSCSTPLLLMLAEH